MGARTETRTYPVILASTVGCTPDREVGNIQILVCRTRGLCVLPPWHRRTGEGDKQNNLGKWTSIMQDVVVNATRKGPSRAPPESISRENREGQGHVVSCTPALPTGWAKTPGARIHLGWPHGPQIPILHVPAGQAGQNACQVDLSHLNSSFSPAPGPPWSAPSSMLLRAG